MESELIVFLAASGLFVAGFSFLVGRHTGSGAVRRRELEAEIERTLDEVARLGAEADSLRAQLAARRKEAEAYRLSVVEHFSGTSDLLRDLTVQYRSVYEHLTQGASTLCPEGFVGLVAGLPTLESATAGDEREPEEKGDVVDAQRSSEVARSPGEIARPEQPEAPRERVLGSSKSRA